MKCFGYSKSFTQQCVLYYQKELVVAAKVDPQNFENTKWREWGNCNCFVKRVPPPTTTTTTTKTVPAIEAMVVRTTTTTADLPASSHHSSCDTKYKLYIVASSIKVFTLLELVYHLT